MLFAHHTKTVSTRPVAWVGPALIAITLAGCGVRETVAPDGSTNREIFVGAVPRIDCEDKPAHSARQVQLGLWVTANTAGVGYQSALYFCGAPRCQVTLWADGASRADVEEIARRYQGICVANKEGD